MPARYRIAKHSNVMTTPSEKMLPKLRHFMGLGILLLIAIYLLAVPLGAVSEERRLSTSEIIILAVLLVFSSNIIERLEEFSIGPSGVAGRLRQLERKVQVLASQVAFRGIVNTYELDKLRGLAADGPFLVHYNPRMYEELRHLDAMQFVSPTEGHGLVDLKNSYAKREDITFNLKDYVAIRKEGREYLDLLDEIRQITLPNT